MEPFTISSVVSTPILRAPSSRLSISNKTRRVSQHNLRTSQLLWASRQALQFPLLVRRHWLINGNVMERISAVRIRPHSPSLLHNLLTTAPTSFAWSPTNLAVFQVNLLNSQLFPEAGRWRR